MRRKQKAKYADNNKMDLPNLKDNIQKILNGTAEEKKAFEMTFCFLAKTPMTLKDCGLTGDYFSVRYGIIARHKGKDANHSLSAKNWIDLCEEITRPFAVVRYGSGYRMFVNVKVNNNLVAVGVAVKKIKRDLEVNAVTTTFGYEGSVQNADFVYVAESLTPEQLALLNGLNFRQYLAARGGGGGRGDEVPQTSPEGDTIVSHKSG